MQNITPHTHALPAFLDELWTATHGETLICHPNELPLPRVADRRVPFYLANRARTGNRFPGRLLVDYSSSIAMIVCVRHP
jgi:hypothetical protein